MRFKPFSTSSLLALLVVSSSALSFADVVEKVQEKLVEPVAEILRPTLTLDAKQIPCCAKGCSCPTADVGRGGEFLSIEYNNNFPVNFRGHPAGCGADFSEEACLYFMQTTFKQLDVPLEIAIKKAGGCEADRKHLGCGEHSTVAECLRYLHGFFKHLLHPLELTIEYAGKGRQQVDNGDEVVGGGGEGKSEL